MNEWIDARERLPTHEDADVYGCVEAWHIYQGNMITGWQQIGRNSFFSHWKRVTPPPGEHRELGKTYRTDLSFGVKEL